MTDRADLIRRLNGAALLQEAMHPTRDSYGWNLAALLREAAKALGGE